MKIVIAGNYGAHNIGDELILAGLLQSLKDAFKEPKITVLSASPQATSKLHKVTALPLFPAGIRSFFKSLTDKRNLKALKEADYFFLGGGGLFNDLSSRANKIWAKQAKRAIKHNIPLVMIGQSVGPTRNKKLIKKIFSKAQLIAVRDQQSRKFLQDCQITQPIHVTPDFALKIPAPYKPAQKTVLVALRNTAQLTTDKVKEVAKFLNWLKTERGYKINLIDFQTNGHEQDCDLSQKLAAQTGATHLPAPKDFKQLENAYNQASLVIGMRLHSIINAIRQAKPYIGISYASKVNDFLASVGLPQAQKLEELSYESLKLSYENLDQQTLHEKELDYTQRVAEVFKNFEENILSKLVKH